ncbi:hypothetical protein [Bacillus paramycoides]|uniref:hypothetical protein n=1 Tax=Bacillus paramycoides TaxID=2026194 RepID=UPI002E239629|nr:hypothetical protein [Bacillus paramycoides]MED0987940.1 hypothetical protein [Bacillus paramycoides]
MIFVFLPVDNSRHFQQLERNYKEIKTELASLQEEMKKIKNYVDICLEERDQLLVATLREVLKSNERNIRKNGGIFGKEINSNAAIKYFIRKLSFLSIFNLWV